MEIEFDELIYLKDPSFQELKADYEQFLMSLISPTVIDISGEDPSRWRACITLLHGNEPSGLIAIHRWLTAHDQLPKPTTNVRLIICSVEAANSSPLFSKRSLDGGKDINRCFGQNKQHQYYQRANIIEQAIKEVSPEVIIDIHNSSGCGPAFAVSPVITPEVLSLTSYFCQTVILSGLKLGTLMEQNFNCPLLTIESGGSDDEQAHKVAHEGLTHLFQHESAANLSQTRSVDVIYKPLRLRLLPQVTLSYAKHDEGVNGVCLTENIELLNFGISRKGQMLGWLDDKGLDNLRLENSCGNNVIKEYFTLDDNKLTCFVDLRIFMATKQAKTAIDDCLFYIVKV
jgi:hypothetical protein